MARKLLLNSPKDDQGRYLPVIPPEKPKGTLEDILQRQLAGLELLTEHLVTAIKGGDIHKDTAQQLATCIKITMDLKAKENEMLDNMSDEELRRLAKSQDSGESA